MPTDKTSVTRSPKPALAPVDADTMRGTPAAMGMASQSSGSSVAAGSPQPQNATMGGKGGMSPQGSNSSTKPPTV